MMNVTAAVVIVSLLLACAPAHAQATKPKPKPDPLESGLPADVRWLKIGDPAPDFALKGTDDKTYTLADFKDAPVLLVAFLSNHCPASHAIETRLIPFVTQAKARGLATVAINPNSPDAVRLDELGYSKYNDGFDEMKLYAKDQGFTFPYLYDGDTQKTSKDYGCLCTPHVFVFDRERKLRYAGRWDDSRYADPSTVKSRDAEAAIGALLDGKPVPVEITKPFGCSTKWLEKKGENLKVEEKWTNAPVTMETIDVVGVAKLAKNDTNKLRLINVWATWCAPCVAEFPGLVSFSRRFQGRDFELITISIDDPAHETRARAFLEKQHASSPPRVIKSLEAEGRSTNNYLYTGPELEGMLKALDPQWQGPVPHTIVVAPGGKVIYRKTGIIDVEELQAKLLDTMGPYYTPAQKR